MLLKEAILIRKQVAYTLNCDEGEFTTNCSNQQRHQRHASTPEDEKCMEIGQSDQTCYETECIIAEYNHHK